MYADWEAKKESFLYRLEGDDKIAYYKALSDTSSYSAPYLTEGYPDHYCYVTYFEDGVIFTFNYHLYSDGQKQILKRFASVFSLTYRRYKDLEKAEAQAREAQIEAALEKVRSRSLAMHKSTELQDVVNIVSDKVQELGIKIDSASVIVLPDKAAVMEYWIAVPGQQYSTCFHIPYFDHTAISRDFIRARKSGNNFTKSYTGTEKNEQWNYLFEHSDLKHLPAERKKFLLETTAYTVSAVFTKNTALQLLRYYEEAFSEREIEIFQRFANVFEQAYIRFLD